MPSVTIKFDTRVLKNWDAFHDTFVDKFGFPDFYGRNMNAWIDCMTSLDCPEDGMTTVHAPPGGVVVIQLEHVTDFRSQHPVLYDCITECSAFVNYRRMEMGKDPVLALSFHA